MDFALRLTEERERLGFSLRGFADQLGISLNGLRYYEQGQRKISTDFLAKAAGFGVDVQYILTGVRSGNILDVEKSTSPIINVKNGKNVIGYMHDGVVNQINTNNHKTIIKAEVKPGDVHIDEKQAARLTNLVKDICAFEEKLKKNPKSFRSVWASLNSHMNVTRYRLIKKEDFLRAEKYLLQWIGRLTSMKSAPVVDGDTWRKRKYAYIKINTKDDQESLANYIKRNFGATSLTELSNDELEQTYRYIAGRRNTRKRNK